MTIREELLADTFVELADTLVAEFDLIDFLHVLVERTVSLLDADAGGIMLADQRGGLEVLAASSHEVRLIELFEIQNEEGPCLEAFTTGQSVTRNGPDEMRASWPRLTDRLESEGYASAQAVPLRLREEIIGALNIFGRSPGALGAQDMKLARALADVATVGILQERSIRTRDRLAEQLQGALNSRVVIEQAKGVLAARHGLSVEQAFTAMRTHARRRGLQLPALAHGIVHGELDLDPPGRGPRSR